MANDLGVTALVEFEATGQSDVLAGVSAVSAGMAAMERAIQSPANASGLFNARFERDARAAQLVAMGWAASHQQAMEKIVAWNELAAQSARDSARSVTAAAKAAGQSAGELGSVLSSVQGKLAAVGLAIGFQQLIAVLQESGRAVNAWAAEFEGASVSAQIAVARITARLQELSGENERIRIGTDIEAQIATLKSRLGDEIFEEGQESRNPWKGLRGGLEDLIAGFDTGAAKIGQLRQQIFDLEKLRERAATQPLANAGEPEAQRRAQAAAAEAKARLEAKAELERQLELNYQQDDRRRWSRELDATGDNPLARAQVLERQRMAMQDQLNRMKAVEVDHNKMSAEQIARQLGTMRELQGEIDRVTQARDQAEADAWKPRAARDDRESTAPGLDLRFDRLTRLGATLGDPALPGPSRRDPAYFQERANELLREIRDGMREARRAQFAGAGFDD